MLQTLPRPTTSSMLDRELVYAAIARFLRGVDAARAPSEVTAATPLVGAGLLDSLSMLQLTMALSDEFGIAFDDGDFTLENFETADRLATLVSAKHALR